ncbi:hypothetical protein F5B21DRAFT_474203 [Xylaria acuta]|nr:hypothetical protein F5B21DRAFT_474203 [Xylaria acuta]
MTPLKWRRLNCLSPLFFSLMPFPLRSLLTSACSHSPYARSCSITLCTLFNTIIIFPRACCPCHAHILPIDMYVLT